MTKTLKHCFLICCIQKCSFRPDSGSPLKPGYSFTSRVIDFTLKSRTAGGKNKLLSRLENEVKILKLQILLFKRQRRCAVRSEQKSVCDSIKSPYPVSSDWGLKGGRKAQANKGSSLLCTFTTCFISIQKKGKKERKKKAVPLHL